MAGSKDKKIFFHLLDEIDDTLVDFENRCLKLENSDHTTELRSLFRAAHNIKGAAQLYGLKDFASLVHALEDLLGALQSVLSESLLAVDADSTDLMLTTQSFLRNWVAQLREDDKYLPDFFTIKSQLVERAQIVKNQRTSSSQTKGSASPTTPPKTTIQEIALSPVPESIVEKAALETPAKVRKQRLRAPTETIRVPAQKIDEIMQFLGELSINQGILVHNLRSNTLTPETCRHSIELNQKSIAELYDLILTLRMQPSEILFQRVERTVRDLARIMKKQIQLAVSGGETPLDKIVLEMITDPMMHLVRNAVDHGIETESERRAAGKSPTATISIQVRQDAGQVTITVSDDGKGMDPARILKRAQDNKLVPLNKKMSKSEILDLICLPGFTTRDSVSEISGRGVGMDIVLKVIENLNGRLEINSDLGVGTTFQVHLPANLEIIEGLTVKITGQLYVIPRQEIQEIINLKDFEVRRMGDDGRAIHYRGMVVPVDDLSDYIGQETGDPPPIYGAKKNKISVALIIRLNKSSRLALCIDELIDQRKIVVRPLAASLSRLPCFSGVTILGDGEPTMIINTAVVSSNYLKWIGQEPVETSSANYGESA